MSFLWNSSVAIQCHCTLPWWILIVCCCLRFSLSHTTQFTPLWIFEWWAVDLLLCVFPGKNYCLPQIGFVMVHQIFLQSFAPFLIVGSYLIWILYKSCLCLLHNSSSSLSSQTVSGQPMCWVLAQLPPGCGKRFLRGRGSSKTMLPKPCSHFLPMANYSLSCCTLKALWYDSLHLTWGFYQRHQIQPAAFSSRARGGMKSTVEINKTN